MENGKFLFNFSFSKKGRAITERVIKTIEKERMLGRTNRILVGLSGGPDSVCLLSILNKLKERYKIKLFAFHLNHKLRAKEADGDAKFVRNLCRKLKIPCRIETFDIRNYAKKNHLSLETAAREIRYRLLEKERQRTKSQRIALGHNLNDNAETVLLNLIRGTGTSGLSGIPPIRARIIRPLIETTREAIIQYLNSEGIAYRLDSSNRNLRYRRNFIRLKIVPLLKRLNPQFTEAVFRTAQVLRAEDSFLQELAKKAVLKAQKSKVKTENGERNAENGIIIDTKRFLGYNIALRRRILRLVVPELDYQKIEEILALLNRPTGKINLWDNYYAVKEYNDLFIGKLKSASGGQNSKFKTQLPVPLAGIVRSKEFGVELKLEQYKMQSANIKMQNLTKKWQMASSNWGAKRQFFDLDELKPPLFLRNRKPGDRFTPFGMRNAEKGNGKKLKEVLIDDKIPVRLRDRLPLLCDKKGILWILGSRRSARAPVTPKTKKVLVATLK